MNIDDFQRDAFVHARYPANHALSYTLLALAGEVGEACNEYKKVMRGDYKDSIAQTQDALNKVADELGDCLWYIAASAKELGLPLSVIAQNVLDKLETRKALNANHMGR